LRSGEVGVLVNFDAGTARSIDSSYIEEENWLVNPSLAIGSDAESGSRWESDSAYARSWKSLSLMGSTTLIVRLAVKYYLSTGISSTTGSGSGSGTTSAAFILWAQDIEGSTGAAAFIITGRLLGLGTPFRVGDGARLRAGDGALKSTILVDYLGCLAATGCGLALVIILALCLTVALPLCLCVGIDCFSSLFFFRPLIFDVFGSSVHRVAVPINYGIRVSFEYLMGEIK
jgi:hypothetical protein